jgi:hypothetical protein
MMTTRTLAYGCSAAQKNPRKKILVDFHAILNVPSRMEEPAFCRVASARNLMVVITALTVGKRTICLGKFSWTSFLSQICVLKLQIM